MGTRAHTTTPDRSPGHPWTPARNNCIELRSTVFRYVNATTHEPEQVNYCNGK